MSYLDPRAGQASGDDTSVPAPFVHGPPGLPEEQYADRRRTQAVPVYPDPAWHADERAVGTAPESGPMTGPGGSAAEPAGRPTGKGRRRARRGQKSGAGRAGRNLPAAIAVGLSLGLVVLASLFLEPLAFLGLLVVAAGIGVWEMARALSTIGSRPPLVPLVAGSTAMIGLTWFYGLDAMLLSLLATVGASALWRLADGVVAVRRDFTGNLLTVVYVPFLLSFAALLVQPDDGALRIVCTLVAVVLSDTGGYAAGVFLGRHPMAPKISPKKSWEGFAGSVTASAIGSGALLYFLLDVPVYWGLLFGAVMSVVAVLGDLSESMLKRDIGVKDMSNLLPGHGGLMDRLDSIVFAVPVAYLLFSIITPG